MSSPVTQADGYVEIVGPPDGVCCRECEDVALADVDPRSALCRRTFIVCSDCGNKRCPKATNHALECTGSNATGQPGSRYA